jgi:hypothetical protein
VPLADVEVVIREDPFRYTPEWGIGGFAPDAQTVLVNVAAARVDE